tara:strand:- start:121 stop:2121 length:2001 start_codon:yes stop_codon:yes gene_type:complete
VRANPSNLLSSLSNNDVTFFIPPYQRNYEWSESTCQVFFNDVSRVAKSNLEDTYAEHFFGSIVYVIEDAGFGVPDRYILTDGQQRITTTMLFLMALRDSVSDEEFKDSIQKKYLENERTKEGSEFKVKLKQVETDWEAYRLLALKLEVPEGLKHSSVHKNYSFFHRQLSALTEPERVDLLGMGLSKFSIISIQLEPDRNPWENPQEIFESMNSLGKPLSLADLTRNFLLMGMSASEQTELYKKYWLALEKRMPGKLSEFLRDWMQADQHRSFKVAKESNFKELYSQLKLVIGEKDVEAVLHELVAFSRPYAIASGVDPSGDDKVDQLLFDLQLIGVSPAFSYLAELISAWQGGRFSDSGIRLILGSLRTYLLRRRIIGAAAAENKFFPVLGSRIPALCESDDLQHEILVQLSSQEYALRLPNDDEVAARLRGMNFYNFGRSGTYPRLIFSLVEEGLTKARPVWDDTNLQIEHIMPQTLGEHWRKALGENADEVHRQFVNHVGNLTLIRHNQELGNKPFEDKKRVYKNHSGLQVSQNWIIDKDDWNAAEIELRGQKLIANILENVLSVPKHFKQASNWEHARQSDAQFDIREVLNQLIGQEIHFISDSRITARVVSESKVHFEGEDWSLSPLTTVLKQRSGNVSGQSNFSGAQYWTWDDVRLGDLDL